MKKQWLMAGCITVVLILAAGCNVKKTGEDTYQVNVDTKPVKDAATEIKEEAGPALERAREGAVELGHDIKEGAQEARDKAAPVLRDAARKTGEAIERGGQEIKEHSKPGDQP